MKFRARSLVVAAFLAAGFCVVPVMTNAAHAGLLDVTCPVGTGATDYNPGVTSTPSLQQVTVNNQYGECVSLSHPNVTSGSNQNSFRLVLSCNDLLTAGPATNTITWNTGQTSRYSATTTVTTVDGNEVVTETGSVTSGLFTGDGAVVVATLTDVNIAACLLGTPITSTAGTTTLEFTSL